MQKIFLFLFLNLWNFFWLLQAINVCLRFSILNFCLWSSRLLITCWIVLTMVVAHHMTMVVRFSVWSIKQFSRYLQLSQWNTKIYKRRGWSSMWIFFFTVYSLYYAKPRNKLEVLHLRVIAPAGNRVFFFNVAAVANCRQLELQRIFLGGRKTDISP